MEGKFINELEVKQPDPQDLLIFWDQATGTTAQTTIESAVASAEVLPSGGLSGQALTIGLDGTPGWNYAVSDLTELLAAIPANMPFQNDFMAGIRILPQYNDADGHPVLATTQATSLVFPRAIVAQIFLVHNHSVTEIHLPSVVECQLTLNDCTELTKLELGNCERFRQAVFLNLPKLKTITLTATQTNGISFQNCAELTDVNLAQILSIHGDISAHSNPKLVSFELKEVHLPSVNLNHLTGNVLLHGNALGATSVNNILMALVSLNGLNGTSFWGPGKTVDLTGGTNAAPTGAGIEHAKTLIARGATVKVNGPAITTNHHITQIPDYDTVANRGMVPTVKTDGTGVEWKAGSSTATNLAGGTFANIVFQQHAGDTSFIPTPEDDGRVLYCGGLASGTIPPFQWVKCAIVPPATVANASKVLTVKADGTGAEWKAGLPANPLQGQALVWNGNLGNLKWTAQYSVPYADSIWEDGAVPMGSLYGKPGGNNGWFLPGQLGQVLRMGYAPTDTNRTNLKPVWDTASNIEADLADKANVIADTYDGVFYISGKVADNGLDPSGFRIKAKNFNVNSLIVASDFTIHYNDIVENVAAKSLTHATDSVSFDSCNALKTVDFQSLLVSNLFSIKRCPNLTAVNIKNLAHTDNSVVFTDLPLLTTLDLTSLQTCYGGITVRDNIKLSNLIFPLFRYLAGGLNLTGNAFTESVVNEILIRLASMDGKNRPLWGVNSSVQLSGGTNAAPTGAGITAAQTLISRGCMVTVNGTAITTTKKVVPLVPEFDKVADVSKTLAVKADGTSTEWKALSGIDIATQTTGTVPLARGGTGATTSTGAIVNLLPPMSGNADKALCVNSAGTGIEYRLSNSGGLPAGGTAGQIVTIRADSGAIEWRTASDIEFNIGTALDAITDGRGFSTPFFIAGHIRSTSTSANPGNVQLSGLIVAKEIYISSWESSVFTLKLPSLTLVRNSINIQRTYATSIEMPVLNYVENVNISNNSLLSNLIINFSSYGPSAFLQISSNPNLTTLDLSRMWLCNVDIGILVTNNSKLTTLKLAPFIFRSGFIDGGGKSLSLNGNALTQACVDEILAVVAHMDGLSGTTNFGTGYSLSLNAGTNAAPSAAGVVNKDKIVARGATVTTN